jgi:hypothetical protein
MRSCNNLIRNRLSLLVVARIRSSLHVGSHKLCLLLTPAVSLPKSPETTKEEVELYRLGAQFTKTGEISHSVEYNFKYCSCSKKHLQKLSFQGRILDN